eukprot:2208509-Lingulodinium_polyedra.AAC.1
MYATDPVSGERPDLAKAAYVDDLTQMHMHDQQRQKRGSALDRIIERKSGRSFNMLTAEMRRGGFELNKAKT